MSLLPVLLEQCFALTLAPVRQGFQGRPSAALLVLLVSTSCILLTAATPTDAGEEHSDEEEGNDGEES